MTSPLIVGTLLIYVRDFPAPFSFVNKFSSSNVFNLTCGPTASGAKGCHLPGDTPYSAAITGISD